jgi:hypothetical protein
MVSPRLSEALPNGARITPFASVSPLLIGPRNCEQLTGLSWRYLRDHARELGIEPVHIGRKLVVPAAAFLKALERQEAGHSQEDATNDPAASLRERLGLRLIGGKR